MLFKPTLWLKSVLQIDEKLLRDNNIKGLILDLDNTLSMHGNPAEENGVMEWLDKMRALGVPMAVVSNNTKKRVAPLAAKLGLPFVSFGCKPLTIGLRKGRRLLGLNKKEIAAVGDQIFTDIMGGNLGGMKTILVEPFHLENTIGFKIKRRAEKIFFKRDYSKLERK